MLDCTAPPAAPQAEREPRTHAGSPTDAPGRSVSSAEEAAATYRRNAGAPPGGLRAGTLLDPVRPEKERERELSPGIQNPRWYLQVRE